MIRTALAVLTVAIGATAVVAQADLVQQRSNLMKLQGQNMWGTLNRMARGENPYDQAKVDEAFGKLAETSPKISSLFPESTKGMSAPNSQYISSAKIWENKADFDARVAKFVKSVSDNQSKVKSLDDLKAVYPVVNQDCTGCHDQFRQRKS